VRRGGQTLLGDARAGCRCWHSRTVLRWRDGGNQAPDTLGRSTLFAIHFIRDQERLISLDLRLDGIAIHWCAPGAVRRVVVVCSNVTLLDIYRSTAAVFPCLFCACHHALPADGMPISAAWLDGMARNAVYGVLRCRSREAVAAIYSMPVSPCLLLFVLLEEHYGGVAATSVVVRVFSTLADSLVSVLHGVPARAISTCRGILPLPRLQCAVATTCARLVAFTLLRRRNGGVVNVSCIRRWDVAALAAAYGTACRGTE